MEVTSTHELLKGIYKNATTGSESTRLLLSKTSDNHLRGLLENQISQYDSIAAEAEKELTYLNEEPYTIGAISKAQLWTSIQMSTMTNQNTSHLAQMMVEGNNMGIIETTKLMNDYTDADQASKNLGNQLVQFESACIDSYKMFL